MDLAVIFDPESEWWEIGLSGFSLAINGMTGGAAPNVGVLLRVVKRVRKPPPIVIGENMTRVNKYASKVGAKSYGPWKNDPFDRDLAMKRNENWIKGKMREGREIIDIGPDFARRDPEGVVSPFYVMERQNLKGYANRKAVFQRSGPMGGVPGLDF